jgi:thiol peroxidase
VSAKSGQVTMHGNPLTLVGNRPEAGAKAPDFQVLDNGLAPVDLSSFAGKICLISSVPSLDTPVCDTQTRKFNEAATALSGDVAVLTISMDLPFAQARWCGAAGIERVQTLSDHRDASFGKAFGLLIKELRLLARAVYVVDREGVLRYGELVGEIAEEPGIC